MNLLNFIGQYPDEESCKLKLKTIRDKEGVVCRHCGGKDHYWKSDKWQYECKTCKTRTTLRSGTVMHGSQLPFRYWFVAMHLLTSTKKSFSAIELQRQLGHKYYEPIWTMLHKLRLAMGKRDSQYELSGQIELDEGFFATEVKSEEKNKPLKRGRGSQKKTKVLVMTESKDVQGKVTKKGKPRKVGFIKMQVIPDLKAETINDRVTRNISNKATLITDDSTSYTDFENLVEKHQAKVIPKEKVGEVLPWVHLAISNAKRILLDIHHNIKPEFLQGYLNEFCYKFNRRYFGEAMFDRLLLVSATSKNDFRYRIR
jgi:ISXO2-like transposase domain/Transposase zinc-ribbon domain